MWRRSAAGWRSPRLFAIIGLVLRVPVVAAWYLAGEYEFRRNLRERGVIGTSIAA